MNGDFSLPLVYIAGPISKGDLLSNIRQADEAFLELVAAGFSAINPMLSVYAGGATRPAQWGTSGERPVWATATRSSSLPLTHAAWLAIDVAVIERCDAILRLPGESVGADAEVEHAKLWGLPVCHTVKDVGDRLGYTARVPLSSRVVRKLLPPRRNGKLFTSRQFGYWIHQGRRRKDGDGQVKLRAVLEGGQWMVYTNDVREFVAAAAW